MTADTEVHRAPAFYARHRVVEKRTPSQNYGRIKRSSRHFSEHHHVRRPQKHEHNRRPPPPFSPNVCMTLKKRGRANSDRQGAAPLTPPPLILLRQPAALHPRKTLLLTHLVRGDESVFDFFVFLAACCGRFTTLTSRRVLRHSRIVSCPRRCRRIPS